MQKMQTTVNSSKDNHWSMLTPSWPTDTQTNQCLGWQEQINTFNLRW